VRVPFSGRAVSRCSFLSTIGFFTDVVTFANDVFSFSHLRCGETRHDVNVFGV
jgi:hypothetical protein